MITATFLPKRQAVILPYGFVFASCCCKLQSRVWGLCALQGGGAVRAASFSQCEIEAIASRG